MAESSGKALNVAQPRASLFTKTILLEGSGFECPSDGAISTVCIHALSELPKIEAFQAFPFEQDIHMQIGEGDLEISDLLDQCLETMKKGEESEVSLSADWMKSTFGTSAILKFKVTLKDFQTLKPVWQLNLDEKHQLCLHHKEKGVELFKEGKHDAAFKRFSKATKYLILIGKPESMTKDIFDRCEQLKGQCFANMAQCQLLHKNYSFVITNCTRALEVDPKNVKYLYRRAKGYRYTGNFDKALDDLQCALRIAPNNVAVATERDTILKKQH